MPGFKMRKGRGGRGPSSRFNSMAMLPGNLSMGDLSTALDGEPQNQDPTAGCRYTSYSHGSPWS